MDAFELTHMQVDDIEFEIAGGDAADVLDSIEGAFNQISGAVARADERTLTSGMPDRMWRRDELPAEHPRLFTLRLAFVGLARDELRPANLRIELFE